MKVLKNQRKNLLNMKMVVSYLNFVFFIEVKAKSKYRILSSVFRFIKNTKWHFGYMYSFQLNMSSKKDIKKDKIIKACVKNYIRCFLFHRKSSFRPRNIQIFVIFSLPFHTFHIQVNFLRLLDSLLSKHLIFKRISCMQWLFWFIYQN